MQRRRLLAALSAVGSAAIAGCSGFGDGFRETYDVPETTGDGPDGGPDPDPGSGGPTVAGRPVDRPANLRRRVATDVAPRRRLTLVGGPGGGRAPEGTRLVAGFRSTATAEHPARLWVGLTNPGEDAVAVTMGPRPPFSGVVGRLGGEGDTVVVREHGPGGEGGGTTTDSGERNGTTTGAEVTDGTATGPGNRAGTPASTTTTPLPTDATADTATPTADPDGGTTDTTGVTVDTTPPATDATADTATPTATDPGEGEGGDGDRPPGAGVPYEEVGATLVPVAGRAVGADRYPDPTFGPPSADGAGDRNCWRPGGPVPLGGGERRVELAPGESVVAEYALVGPPEGCLPRRARVAFLSGEEPTSLGLSVWPTDAERPPDSRFRDDRAPPELPDHDRVRWFHRLGYDPLRGPVHPVSGLVAAGDGYGTGTGEGTGTGGPALAPAYLVPERERLELPGTARVTLRNYSRATLSINPADYDLYRLHDGAWKRVAPWRVSLPAGFVPPGGEWSFSLGLAPPATRSGAGPGGRTGREERSVTGLGGGTYALRFGRAPARAAPEGPLVVDGPGVDGDPPQRPTAAPAVLLSVAGPPVRFTFGPGVTDVRTDGGTVRVTVGPAGDDVAGLELERGRPPDGDGGEGGDDGDGGGGSDGGRGDGGGCGGPAPGVELVAEQVTQTPALRNAVAALEAGDADRAVVVAPAGTAVEPFRRFGPGDCTGRVPDGARLAFGLRGEGYLARFRPAPP